MILSREKKDPYDLDFHRSADEGAPYTCPEFDIWDGDELMLREQWQELSFVGEDDQEHLALDCPACEHVYTLWESIIELVGDPVYGELASRAFELEEMIKDFHHPIDATSADEMEYVRAVKAERNRREIQIHLNQMRQAEQAGR